MKENLLSNEAMELSDAELEGAAGGLTEEREEDIKNLSRRINHPPAPENDYREELKDIMAELDAVGVPSGDQGAPAPPTMPKAPGGQKIVPQIAKVNQASEAIVQKLSEMGF